MTLLLSLLLVGVSLLVTSPQVHAVGLCNNETVVNIMGTNGCPSGVLKTLYSLGPQLTYRVMPAARASLIKCATASVSEPDKNVLTITITYSYNDISIADTVVRYNLVESSCGLIYKYSFDNSYEMYKLPMATVNDLAVGYYECTAEPAYYTEGELSASCLTSQEDSEEVTAAAEACRQALATATGATDLVLVPSCTNTQEDTSLLVDIAETVTEIFSVGGIINLVEDQN